MHANWGVALKLNRRPNAFCAIARLLCVLEGRELTGEVAVNFGIKRMVGVCMGKAER